jgi:hypothetical protein
MAAITVTGDSSDFCLSTPWRKHPPPWCNEPMTHAGNDSAAWPMQPGSGRGRSHGTSAAQPFDRWFRYPAGFASDYVALLLDRIHLDEGLVLDCFMGSGVTGTAAHARGLGFVGLEAHPLIAELATLKLQAPASSEALLDLADGVAISAQEDVFARLSVSNRKSADAGAEPANDLSSYPWLLSETELVRRSFDPAVLAALVSLRDAIKPLSDNALAAYLKWALLATLRDVAGVKVGWPYQRPGVSRAPRHKDALKRFLARVKTMAQDLRTAPSETVTHISVGNAADSEAWAALPASQACVTSPPYLNNFDYADATRLELYFWGEVRSWRQMCDEVRGDMLTATTQQSSKAQKALSLESLTAYGATGADIAALTKNLEDARGQRNGRSKEYDQVLPAYFTAMGAVLANAFDKLESGATALWLVGDSAPYDVFVDTPALIGRLASEIGFENKEDVLLRTRGHRWSKPTAPSLSERMIVLRKP